VKGIDDDVTGRLVVTRREERVLIISMVRGAKRNAIDRTMADALDDALNELDDDAGLWAGILTGTTEVFSAGSDLTAGGDYVTSRGGEYGIIRRRRRKPLIAAVEGPALGGGLEIVLACDLVVAARTARFGLPEVGIGVVPTCAGLFRAPRALPLNLARQLILTGRPIEAQRAYEVGLVNVLTITVTLWSRLRLWLRRSAPIRRSRSKPAWPPSTTSSLLTTNSAGFTRSAH
jgi:enoyl-CoA hydratase